MNLLRGWIGEKKTTFYLWLWLRKKSYHRFHDIILPSKNGTTQIDHLVISVYGLFIVETKNKKGWIFGSEKQPRWTQSIYGKKYSFQNPLRQTFRQMKILAEYLNMEETKIHSVIYFVGDCKFKTPMPDNVRKWGLARYIKKFRKEILSYEEVTQIVSAIQRHISESTLSSKDHRRSLRNRHSSKTICPKCGSNLIERMARKGPNAGTSFLGCSNYPQCRYSANTN